MEKATYRFEDIFAEVGKDDREFAAAIIGNSIDT
jgi:hypothetical protein